MADESTVKISIVTAGDTTGAQQVERAVESVKDATREEQEQADFLGKSVADLRKQREELTDSVKGLTDAEAGVIRVTKEQVEEMTRATQKTGEMDAATARLPTSLRGLAVGLGGAAVTLGVFKAGFDAFLEQHPEVQASLDGVTGRVKELASTALSTWFETWVMSAETAKSTLDGLTIALGGQTEEMRKANGPLEDFAGFSDAAATASKALADELGREAENAREAMEAIDGEVEALKRRNELIDAKGDLELSRKKREIDADPMLDAGQKAKLKAAEENKADEERRRRAQEERDAETAAAARKAQIAREQAAQAEQKSNSASGAGNALGLQRGWEAQIKALEQALRLAQNKQGNAVTDEQARADAAEVERITAMLNDARRNRDELSNKDRDPAVDAARSKADEEIRQMELGGKKLSDEEKQKIVERAVKEALDAVKKNASEARDAADKASKEASEVAARNATANDVDATKTTQRIEERNAAADEVVRREEQKRADQKRRDAERAEREARQEAEKQAREEEKRQAEEKRRLESQANAAGRDVRGDGSAAVAGVREGGMQQAAAALQSALGALNDGATAQELATVQQLVMQIAQSMNARGDGNQQLREQLRGLNESLKTLKGAVEKLQSREVSNR